LEVTPWVNPSVYVQRRPETTMLYRIVSDHVETLLAEGPAPDKVAASFPKYVEETFYSYLSCGIFAHGFCRVRCRDCGHDRLVAFSCKKRGLCPSCVGRRAADSAAHLIDHVLPDAHYRQWTFSLPRWLRIPMAKDTRFLSAVLRELVRALFAYQRKRARALGIARPQPAAFTWIQRFGSLLQMNPHFHLTCVDGVFVEQADGNARLYDLPPPCDDDVLAVLSRAATRIVAMIRRTDDAEDDSEDHDDESTMAMDAACAQALAPAQSVLGRLARFRHPPGDETGWSPHRSLGCVFGRRTSVLGHGRAQTGLWRCWLTSFGYTTARARRSLRKM
jgi:hypothetical protein